MLTIDELSKVYNKDYFAEGEGLFTIDEKSNMKGGNIGLKSVVINNCGKYLKILPEWLGNGNQYRVFYENIRYRKDCDCTALVEKDGKCYLFFIELKSGIGGVFDDALYKYPGVYFRTKSNLYDFVNHYPDNFEELALIIYSPDAPTPSTTAKSQNNAMFTQKLTMINTPEYQKRREIRNKYKKRLVDKKLTSLDGVDFGVETLPIRQEYKMQHLKAVLWSVSYPKGSVNLDEVISLL